ncbi:MAG: nuclear transport factor 2 family protein [Planctomycetota bacterium]|jgi:ketosteroid isomerase-like protein
MRSTHRLGCIGLTVLALTGCAATPRAADVERVLDDFHAAAAEADEERYFAHLADDGVFIGTDATERWPKAEFRAFAHPYFERGAAWTYVPRTRHVQFAPDGRTAWFDELLDHAKYGECRGTGVLVRDGGSWRITQYVLTFPIPNEIAPEVIERIREVRPELQPTATSAVEESSSSGGVRKASQ